MRDTSAWDGRGNNFDVLRLGLAVLVILSHAYPLATGSETAEPFLRVSRGQVTGGAVAVDCFFVMSGFLIALSAERSRSVWTFLKKRCQRIYPAFVVAALLALFVVLPWAGGALAPGTPLEHAADVALSTLRLREFAYRGVFAANPYPWAMNGSVWSVAYEFWCYIGVALLLVAGLLRRRGVVLGLFWLSWAVSIAFRVEGWVLGGKALGLLLGPPQIWARLLPLYLAGVVFALYRRSIPLDGRLALGSGVAIVVALVVPVGWTILFPLAGTYLVFFLAFTPHIRLHRFGRFGDFSYGTYLYAFPIEQLWMLRLGHTRPWLLFALATPCTLAVAVLSWYGVERPFLRPARRKETPVEALAEAT